MQAIFVDAIQDRRVLIRGRWEDLLRAERSISPLANPDTLVHLMDLTMNELLCAIAGSGCRMRGGRPHEGHCACGRNPLLVYFSAGRQALREALVTAQSTMAALTPEDRDASLAELNARYDRIAQREIDSFCALCQFRGSAAARSSAATF